MEVLDEVRGVVGNEARHIEGAPLLTFHLVHGDGEHEVCGAVLSCLGRGILREVANECADVHIVVVSRNTLS